MLDVSGETIMTKGAIGHAMYFISSGCVEVEVLPTLVLLGSRDFFGEFVLMLQVYCKFLTARTPPFVHLSKVRTKAIPVTK
jgi:CRP-like cAMP-binding protein